VLSHHSPRSFTVVVSFGQDFSCLLKSLTLLSTFVMLPKSFKSKVKRVYSRITHNRLTTAFFIFTFVHCFAQGVIQSFLFSIDSEYHDLLRGITALADIPTRNFTYLEGSPGHVHLKLCSDIPIKQYNPCDDVFQSTVDVKNPVVDQNHLNAIDRSELALDKVVGGMSIAADRRGGIVFGVNITSGTLNIPLSFQCTQILVHPQQIMRNSMREDATWILLQFWLLVISTMAILYDSVPHILTVLAARSLVTGWAMYAIWRTKYNEGIFEEMIYNSGTPCSINLFPDYFSTRVHYEIPDLILNCTALLIACYLSWTLLQVYTAQSFKCVGAPERINRLNKFFYGCPRLLTTRGVCSTRCSWPVGRCSLQHCDIRDFDPYEGI